MLELCCQLFVSKDLLCGSKASKDGEGDDGETHVDVLLVVVVVTVLGRLCRLVIRY
jgi:hypothetical protein